MHTSFIKIKAWNTFGFSKKSMVFNTANSRTLTLSNMLKTFKYLASLRLITLMKILIKCKFLGSNVFRLVEKNRNFVESMGGWLYM